MTKKVLIILANGHEEIEAVTQIDLLRRAGIHVTTASVNGLDVRGAHNILYRAEISLNALSDTFDAIILPGGMPGTNYLAESDLVLTTLQKSYEKGLICAAICAAPLVLDKAGLLDNKNFTCYPSTAENISKGNYVDQNVVVDGNIITSKGIGTAIPFALTLIEKLLGRDSAQKIAQAILFQGEW